MTDDAFESAFKEWPEYMAEHWPAWMAKYWADWVAEVHPEYMAKYLAEKKEERKSGNENNGV